MRRRFNSFFSYINVKYNYNSTKLLKSWINLRKSIISNRIRVKFLRCIAHNIFPSHIDRLLPKSKFSFKNYKSSHLYNLSKLNFFNRIIRLELRDIYFHIRNSYENMFHLSDEICRTLPVSICNNFF